MEFMLLFLERKGVDDLQCFAEMKEFSGQLARQGKLRRGAPLAAESAAARIRVRDGKTLVTDGPFAESKEALGGFWIVEAASRAEAIEIARRSPHGRDGVVEVHPVQWRDTVPDPEQGKPFLYAFRMEPGLTDPHGAKMREMIAFSDVLKREGKFIETAPLTADPRPARIEKSVVTDGPFAESREGVGGYGLVRAANREEALEIAKRYPHAKWGPVEVREILFFDPT